MSERADDDVRGEQRKAARQLKQQQQQLQRGEASTAMATGAERRSLPSPEIMLGQPWSNWVDAVKLHGIDDSEESLKECGKNREAMRLCRDDMPIFGQCPAQDDFYLVMCSHCSQVVKPQAFQAHYERRHSSSSKPSSSVAPSPAYAMSTLPHRSRGSGGGGISGGVAGRPSIGNSTSLSSSSSSSNSKTNKSAKEFSGHGRPPFFPKVPHDKIPTPAAVKVEKVDSWKGKVESSANKMGHAPASSSTTVSSPMKPGLSCPSIPKPPTLAPGQIPNGKGHLSLPDKKQDNSVSSKRLQYKRPIQEREFNPDIHCGVVDLPARKPCTRSLTCKTHSLSQRRAVPGRGKRFDTLLAEHKSKAREKELQHRSDLPLQTPPLRDPHPSPSRLLQDPHQVSHGNGTTDATKPSLPSKPKPHNPGLPRLNSSTFHSGGPAQGDPSAAHEPPHHPPPAAVDSQTRLSSDEGENEEREEGPDKLDCHYSGYHPRPAAYCTFGSRLYGRSCHSFDRRWDRVRCAFSVMMDKHVNSQMWKKIPLALENSSAHRTSTNSLSSFSTSTALHSVSPSPSGFRSPPPAPPAPPPPAYGQSHDGKSSLSYGTTLNARAAGQGSAEHHAYGAQSRQVSSSPQMPSPHPSLPSLASGRPLKQPRTSSKSSFRPKEQPSASMAHSTNTATNSSSSSSGASLSLGKKRKNSSLLMAYTTEASPSSSSSSSSSSLSPFKRNCVVGSGSSGSSFHASLASSNPSSTVASSSSSSSHTGVYTVGLNCTPGRTSGLSLRHEPSARGPPSASPAESIKRMSVVMNSSDSTLSLGPFVHQGGDSGQQQHGTFGHPDARLEGKKRKGSPASSAINSSGGLSGGQGPGRPKVAKSPSVNNIHSKHARTIPGTPGLSNNSLIHQPKARP
ncbi:ataxin-7 isoform X2 [Clupea harengus]|nr:ataxin-7 isoform X2 [Clupea harengus]XP_031423348.1 ataxin-7 isoform X2 [Clupea harengus]XP_031423349.1 ataxin-7 isoform X2 [Clupea harengus]XP_031423350.1 ataxin-7 isoform X2 [Clupea harengus]